MNAHLLFQTLVCSLASIWQSFRISQMIFIISFSHFGLSIFYTNVNVPIWSLLPNNMPSGSGPFFLGAAIWSGINSSDIYTPYLIDIHLQGKADVEFKVPEGGSALNLQVGIVTAKPNKSCSFVINVPNVWREFVLLYRKFKG